jgi:5-methyltetrahydropteroyltriglutamate--homocysteine methyltransferase
VERSTDRVLTTHAGSVPRTPVVLGKLQQSAQGQTPDRAMFDAAVSQGVEEVVRQQTEAGIDIVNNGEMSKQSFMGYYIERLGGFTARQIPIPEGAALPMPIALEAEDYPAFFERWAFNAGARALQQQGHRPTFTTAHSGGGHRGRRN